MDWTFSSTPKLSRLLKNLEKRQQQLVDSYLEQIRGIMTDPQSGKKLRGDLNDYYSWDWKFQNVPLRICYKTISETNSILIVYFGTRQNFYEEVKNYVK